MPSDPEIYSRQLFEKGHGYPLWVPEPSGGAPGQPERGLSIGDVGYITRSGGFETAFNICSRADDPVNHRGVPRNFEPLLILDQWMRRIPLYHGPNSVIVNGKSFGAGPAVPITQSGAGTDIQCTWKTTEGAFLHLPNGATRFECLPGLFHDYIKRHAHNWDAFINETLGCHLPPGSIFLVTGCDVTDEWTLGSFHQQSTSRAVSLQISALLAEGRASLAAADQRDEPSPFVCRQHVRRTTGESSTVGSLSSDGTHCVFFQGLRITTERNVIFNRIKIKVQSPEGRRVLSWTTKPERRPRILSRALKYQNPQFQEDNRPLSSLMTSTQTRVSNDALRCALRHRRGVSTTKSALSATLESAATLSQVDVWLENLLSASRVIAGVGKALPFPFAQGICEGVAVLLEQISLMRTNQEDLKALAEEAVETAQIVLDELQSLTNAEAVAEGYQRTCDEFALAIFQVTEKLRKLSQKPKGLLIARRFFEAQVIQKEVAESRERIRKLKDGLTLASVVGTRLDVSATRQGVENVGRASEATHIAVADMDESMHENFKRIREQLRMIHGSIRDSYTSLPTWDFETGNSGQRGIIQDNVDEVIIGLAPQEERRKSALYDKSA